MSASDLIEPIPEDFHPRVPSFTYYSDQKVQPMANIRICKCLGTLVHCCVMVTPLPCSVILSILVRHSESDLGFGCHGPLRIRDVALQRLPWRPAWYGIPASPRPHWTSTKDAEWCNQSGLTAEERKEIISKVLIMTSKHFPHHWPSVRGSLRWPVDSPNKGPVMWNTFPHHGATIYMYISGSCTLFALCCVLLFCGT